MQIRLNGLITKNGNKFTASCIEAGITIVGDSLEDAELKLQAAIVKHFEKHGPIDAFTEDFKPFAKAVQAGADMRFLKIHGTPNLVPDQLLLLMN